MSVWIYVGAAALLGLVFAGLWWLDARRAEQVSHDPERGDVAPDSRPRRRNRE